MIDGFLTRPSLATLLSDRLRPNCRRINFAFDEARIRHLNAIFVAHAHHDHAMDAPRIAEATGALLFGSQSTSYIAQGAGLPTEQIRVVTEDRTIPIGDFRVSFIRTPHSPDSFFQGELVRPLPQPARVGEYRARDNFSFFVEHGRDRILVVTSTNFRPGAFRNLRASVVFLSIGALGVQSASFVEDYWREAVLASGARLVIPIHWDDFTRPLNRPLIPMPRVADDFDRGMRSILLLANRDGIMVRLPEAFTPIDLDQAPGPASRPAEPPQSPSGRPVLDRRCERQRRH